MPNVPNPAPEIALAIREIIYQLIANDLSPDQAEAKLVALIAWPRETADGIGISGLRTLD